MRANETVVQDVDQVSGLVKLLMSPFKPASAV